MTNLHGTAIIIGERGLLITGPSGSGKTTLALALIEQFAGRSLLCRLIGDDQLLAADHGGRLVCTVPETLAGLVEVPGIGPQLLAYEPAAVIDLLVRLVPASAMARFQEPGMEMVAGCRISLLDLAARNVTAAVPAIAARLALDHFGIE